MPKLSDIILLEHVSQPVLEITKELEMADIADFISESYNKLHAYLKELDEYKTNIPYVKYCDRRKMHDQPIIVSVGIPTTRVLPGRNEIKSTVFPGTKIIECWCRGGYNEVLPIYEEMTKWIEDNSGRFEDTGVCIEYYYNGAEVPEEEYLTKVEFILNEKN